MRQHEKNFGWRAVCKLYLYIMYRLLLAGWLSLSQFLLSHVFYIFIMTVNDAIGWRVKFGQREKIQLLHHLATWLLLGLYCIPAQFTDELTMHLLGAVDLTDFFYYLFKSIDDSTGRLVAQVVFVVVWFARRVFIFGENDWGQYAYKVLDAKASEGQNLYAIAFGIFMGVLLFTNYFWTAEIVRVIGSRLVSKRE